MEQMRIVVSADGGDLEAPASPVFGRCRTYVFVDTDTLGFQVLENPATNAPGGAGIKAAQFVVEHGAQAIVTGSMGPNAVGVIKAANIPVYTLGDSGTVRQAVEAFRAGRLTPLGAHGSEGTRAAETANGPVSSSPSPREDPLREREIADLAETSRELRRRLAGLTEQLERLERRP